jgi:cytochrome c biogenesis protein
VAEGTQASTAILNQPSGVLLQELPFSIELKKFVVEHYSTGMPKLFASDIIIHDKETGQSRTARVEVNHPVNHKGIEIYQSSFDDGGSSVKLQAVALNAQTKPFEVEGVIGNSTDLTNGKEKMTLEFQALRVINVENFGKEGSSATDVRGVDLSALNDRMGAANKTKEKKELRNVGPSITYKLRDAAGQATEYHNYMLPVEMEGVSVFLLGMRTNPNERFGYLRIPADEQSSLQGFVRLNNALRDPALRQQAAARYVRRAVPADKPDLAKQLQASAERALEVFVGTPGGKVRGLQALADFMESNVPEAERAKASEVLVRILNGSLFELLQISREQAKLSAAPADEKTQAFMSQAVLALSDVHLYPAPMTFVLTDFTQVQASVFQVARAPGKNIVYLGCFFLIVGIFAMLYIRERRLWVWLAEPSQPDQALTQASMALSSNRQSMDTDKEFKRLEQQLLGSAP